ncbi:hypothetical protein FHS95_003945 [Sphingomonas naasensis]|uniref:Uncharacterized protein n=1 Tax=Sphingomonas naasensis TaxID=1344951 RepID=A0A4V3QW11_9SPHN|nr:hypothetical protein [Sphingomonas naasensis]NIJ22230.1 hypothetical protein [Sphingomonas naasensis]TGX40752.1 hypothetical protein E5A74_14810 [Sphingomonas naasensis]
MFAPFLIAIAIACMVIGVFLPLDLASQAKTDRFYYAQFEQAAAHVERTGHLPGPAQLGVLEGRSISPLSMAAPQAASDCGSRFQTEASDRFVLSFWRGEWTECYAHPSGRTTLPMSAVAYLKEGAWQLFALLWIVAIGAIWGAIRLTRAPRPTIAAADKGE